MRTVLIVTDIYPPCLLYTSAIKRAMSFARYLPKYGWRCIFLAEACHCAKKNYSESNEIWVQLKPFIDSILIEQIKNEISKWKDDDPMVVRVPCAIRWLDKAWIHLAKITGFRKNEHDEFEQFHRFFPYPDLNSRNYKVNRINRFAVPLRKTFSFLLSFMARSGRNHTDWLKRGPVVGKLICDNVHIDAIISTSSDISNLIVGSCISAKKDIPWIADIRDSVSNGWKSGWKERMNIFRVRKHMIRAKAIIHVTPQEADRDKQWLKRESFIIENGFIEEDIEQAREEAAQNVSYSFIIRFLGYIYPQRNIDLFLNGFRQFISSEQIIPHDILFEYYGHSWHEILDIVTRLNIQHFCQINKAVPPDKALNLTASATVLVLPTNNTGQSGFPGTKFYEYLGVRRPILAAGGRDEYIEDVIKRTKAGVLCYSSEDVTNILKKWFSEWKQNGNLDMPFDDEEIKKFSRQEGVKKLATILNRFC